MTTRIMVLDDDAVTRRSLVELLAGYGYEAFSVGTGEEALEEAGSDEVDIALVDLKMPGMDGIEVLRRLKVVRPEVQVIMITAYATVETAVEAMKLGAFDYIMKPFKGEHLDEVIRGSIEETEFERGLMDRSNGQSTRTAIEMFREGMSDREGLLITGEAPDRLVSEHDLQGAEVVRLTRDEGADRRVDPGDLEGIEGIIGTFARANPRSIVLIHGIEPLVDARGAREVTAFLRRVIAEAEDLDSVLLVSTGLEAMAGESQLEMEDLFQRGYAQEMSESLANPTRRAVVQYLSHSRSSSFTDILSNVPEKESPKLSFHIKKLVNFGVIAKDDAGKYHLTDRGESLVRVLRDLDGEGMRESKTFLIYDGE